MLLLLLLSCTILSNCACPGINGRTGFCGEGPTYYGGCLGRQISLNCAFVRSFRQNLNSLTTSSKNRLYFAECSQSNSLRTNLMLLLEQLCFTCVAQNMTIKTPLLCAYFFWQKNVTQPTQRQCCSMFSSCEVSPLLHFVLEMFQNNSSKKIRTNCRKMPKKFPGSFGESNVLFFVNALQMMCVIQFFFLNTGGWNARVRWKTMMLRTFILFFQD